MRPSLAELLDQLRREGLAADADAAAVRAALDTSADDELPWYLRTVVGLGAWAATAFLLGFLAAVDALRDDGARVVVGLLAVAGALWLRRAAAAEFVRQAAVAASLAGQGLVAIGLGESRGAAAAGVAALALSAALVPLMPDRLHRFLAPLVGAAGASAAVMDLDVPAGLELVAVALVVLAALVWRVGPRGRTERTDDALEPVGYGLVVALFLVLVAQASSVLGLRRVLAGGGALPASPAWVVTAAVTLALAALALAILAERQALRGARAAMVVGAVVALGAATYRSPGIGAGVAALVLGVDRRRPVLVGLAALFLLAFGAVYYYSLALTLGEKAGVLAASGLLCLAARRALRAARP
jgi:hypothetical protein